VTVADNSTQAGTDTIRDKDRAGVKTQIVGLDLGIGTGTESLMSGTMPISGTVDTELPAAAALADATANPTTPAVGAYGLIFNGTTWDRAKSGPAGVGAQSPTGIQMTAQSILSGAGNTYVVPRVIGGLADADPGANTPPAGLYVFNGTSWDRQRGMGLATTTGDAGAKTATGTGATQTNAGNKGASIFIILGTVSGTTPTCVFKVQGSVDGTNFFDVPGAATASLVASVNVGIQVFPGITAVVGAATTGTTATASQALPRFWRLAWTIGGTTPSFTITSVTYNYLPY
jgi:hypothetical protein